MKTSRLRTHICSQMNWVGMHRQSIQKNKQVGDPLTILSNKQTGWGCIDNLVEQTNRVGMHRQSCKWFKQGGDTQTILSNEQAGWGAQIILSNKQKDLGRTDNSVKPTKGVRMHRISCKMHKKGGGTLHWQSSQTNKKDGRTKNSIFSDTLNTCKI